MASFLQNSSTYIHSHGSHLNEDERLLNDHLYLSVEVERLEFKIQVAGDSSCHLTRKPKVLCSYNLYCIGSEAKVISVLDMRIVWLQCHSFCPNSD